jgi:hypothetical protein
MQGTFTAPGMCPVVLYIIGRTTVWACELNAVSWEVWHPD